MSSTILIELIIYSILRKKRTSAMILWLQKCRVKCTLIKKNKRHNFSLSKTSCLSYLGSFFLCLLSNASQTLLTFFYQKILCCLSTSQMSDPVRFWINLVSSVSSIICSSFHWSYTWSNSSSIRDLSIFLRQTFSTNI